MPRSLEGRPPPQGTWKLVLAMIGSFVLSALGVVYAVFCGVAADGGRGGGLAIALTFFMLFMGRSTAEAALEVEQPAEMKDPKEAELSQMTFELARLRNSLASMLDWNRQEKTYLTYASVFGTLVWTFGDLIAKWFGAPAG